MVQKEIKQHIKLCDKFKKEKLLLLKAFVHCYDYNNQKPYSM